MAGALAPCRATPGIDLRIRSVFAYRQEQYAADVNRGLRSVPISVGLASTSASERSARSPQIASRQLASWSSLEFPLAIDAPLPVAIHKRAG